MKKLLLALLLFSCAFVDAQNPIFYMLVGTYTNPPSKSVGIYVYRFNPNRGEATLVSTMPGVSNPSYLTFSSNQKFVYAVNENHGDSSGSVSSFSFDKTTGTLHFLNKVPSGGDDPAYIAVDSSGKFVVVANYSSGNFSVFRTNPDGSLQPYIQLIAHQGYGVNVQRQEMPHPHCTIFSPDEKYLFVTDLGNDRVYHYTFNAKDTVQPVKEMQPPYYEIPDGSGPRHLAFSPNAKYVYLISEMAGNVTAFQYDSSNGSLSEIQSIQSDNITTKGDRASAEIALTADGKFLYTSNREPANNITIYKTQSDGKLVIVGHQNVGIHPRYFMIDPTGRFLLVANRDSNDIQIFVINKNYGLLQDTNVKISVDMPVCIKMVPVH